MTRLELYDKVIEYDYRVPSNKNFITEQAKKWKMSKPQAILYFVDCFLSSNTYDQDWSEVAMWLGGTPNFELFKKYLTNQ